MEKTKKLIPLAEEEIIGKIYFIRGKKVLIDRDLAALYGVETRVLNQAVKRNLKRFPPDFMFQLTAAEFKNWTSQIVISGSDKMGLRKPPLAFTEEGVAMLSSVLNSEIAIAVNIQIIRIFSRMREAFLTQKDILLKLEQLERKMENRDTDIQTIFAALKELVHIPQTERALIGFKQQEE
ncbi:ORF6N domain-containing protein [Chitinophaga sp. CF118]|uniref:ORF6N domain-containing protein n=1 Tax=Chitinophaga sp. CF118 TaxID=1884367 RepID=UPI0008EB58E9|nr:ORF6N domain-containing protein [Chitinophaga sp. CF118]SFD11226.1 ORF6N domain-containing protein [Chitinophaga sp. CF118]